MKIDSETSESLKYSESTNDFDWKQLPKNDTYPVYPEMPIDSDWKRNPYSPV